MEEEPGSESEGDTIVASPLAKWRIEYSRSFQNYIDRSAPNLFRRWLLTLLAAVIYFFRVYYVNGYFVITYGLATYILNLLIGFLSPKVDPEVEASDPDYLPSDHSDEYKPFVRRLPEFKFWYAATKAFVVAFVMTFFSFLDVPVFWPILLCYWLVLYSLTMKRLIVHMFKYRYFPFDVRKPVKLFKFLVHNVLMFLRLKRDDGRNDMPSSSNSSYGEENRIRSEHYISY